MTRPPPSGTGTRWRASSAQSSAEPVLPDSGPVGDHERVYDQTTANEPDPSEPGSRIDPVLARSWLLVNGAQYDRFAPAAHSRADIVVLDIEDAVAPKGKDGARDNVKRWFADGNTDWVRVNGFGTRWWADDLDRLSGTSVGGVMLAMVESVDHVIETAKRLPDVPIVALVETARGLERITETAATKGTFRLAFGIGDFRRDTGFGGNPATLAYARSRFTIADQCPAVNEGLSPSQDEISWPRSSSPSSSATAARSATVRTYPASPVPPRSWIGRRRTASAPRSSATTRITRITCPRRRTPTTTDRLLTVAMEE
jgi:citrate lyase subunit beta / citryl-CoA lyase